MKMFFLFLFLVFSTGCHVHAGAHAHTEYGHYSSPRPVKVYYQAPPAYVSCTNLSYSQCDDRRRADRDRRRFHNRSAYHRSGNRTVVRARKIY